MSLRTLWLVCCMAGCRTNDTGLPYYRSKDLTPEWIDRGIVESPAMHRVGKFELTDQNARRFTERELTGKISVAHFFYTQCDGVCPKTQPNLARLLRDLGGEERIQILSHSVTPAVDSVPALRQYAEQRKITDVRWHLLTGSPQTITELARDSYFANLSDGRSYGIKNIAHTETLYLVDQRRRLRGVYNGTLQLDVERLGEDIRELLTAQD